MVILEPLNDWIRGTSFTWAGQSKGFSFFWNDIWWDDSRGSGWDCIYLWSHNKRMMRLRNKRTTKNKIACKINNTQELEGSTGEMCGEDKFIREKQWGKRRRGKRLEEDLCLYFCLTLMWEDLSSQVYSNLKVLLFRWLGLRPFFPLLLMQSVCQSVCVSLSLSLQPSFIFQGDLPSFLLHDRMDSLIVICGLLSFCSYFKRLNL